jgi:hypothetical protein
VGLADNGGDFNIGRWENGLWAAWALFVNGFFYTRYIVKGNWQKAETEDG